MSKWKNVVVWALVLMLAFAMAVPVLAAGSGKITIHANGQPLTPADRFDAYQVFRGNPGGKVNQMDVTGWGEGVTEEGLIEALKISEIPLGQSTLGTRFSEAWGTYESTQKNQYSQAGFVAKWLADNVNDPAVADAFARFMKEHVNTTKHTSQTSGSDWVIDSLDPGYYLVVDTYDKAADNGEHTQSDSSLSSYILQVVGTAEVTLKATIPTVDKTVEDDSGAVAEIGDTLHFTLTGTVAENISEYKVYRYKFTDTLGEGLTLNEGSVKVQLQSDATFFTWPIDFAQGTDYTLSTGSNELTVDFANLKKSIEDGIKKMVDEEHWQMPPDLNAPGYVNNLAVVVTYEAALNSKAVSGSEGNKNTVKLEYSNNPYKEDGTDVGSTTPEDPEDPTPDEVKTYTLGLQVKKMDKDASPVTEAKFVLRRDLEAEYENTYLEAEGSNTTGYIVKSFSKDKTAATEMRVSDPDGLLKIKGLGLGDYVLEEVATREGLSLMQPVKIHVEVTEETGDADRDGVTDEDGTLNTKITINEDALMGTEGGARADIQTFSNADAQFSTPEGPMITITNFESPILPHTGGIGRTVLFVLGLGLAAAGLLLGYRAGRKKET